MIAHEDEDLLDSLHEHTNSITIPQTTGNELWAAPTNIFINALQRIGELNPGKIKLSSVDNKLEFFKRSKAGAAKKTYSLCSRPD